MPPGDKGNMEALLSKRKRQASALNSHDMLAKQALQDESNQVTGQGLLTDLRTWLDAFDNLQDQIREAGESDNDTYELNEKEYNTILLKYFSVKSQVESLASMQPVHVATPGAPSPPVDCFVKLPSIDLPTFNGNMSNWLHFKDVFRKAVHNSKTLSGSVKLQHLNNSLKGDAASLTKSIIISDSNYDIAWQALLDRYDDKRTLVTNLLCQLYNQPSVSAASSSSLRNLMDTTSACVESLKVLGQPTDQWSTILVHLIETRMDPESKQQWELQRKGNDFPTFAEITNFITTRSKALMFLSNDSARSKQQTSQQGQSTSQKQQTQQQQGQKQKEAAAQEKSRNNRQSYLATKPGTESFKCLACPITEKHGLYRCEKFHALPISDRLALLKRNNRCLNCFTSTHATGKCDSRYSCGICKQKHNTLLHNSEKAPAGKKQADPPSHHASKKEDPPNSTSAHGTTRAHTHAQVLLATALVTIQDINGVPRDVRALIDPGSQNSFITAECSKKLLLRRQKTSLNINGLGSSAVGSCSYRSSFTINSRINRESIHMEAYILDQITGTLPSQSFQHSSWSHLHGLELADPAYNVSSKIDLLLGADVYQEIIEDDIRRGPPGTPIALSSKLGYLLMGKLPRLGPTSSSFLSTTDVIVKRFWETEEVPSVSPHTSEQRACEAHFRDTHTKVDGKYQVDLPFKASAKPLGASLEQAIKRFHSLEKKFLKDPSIKEKYVQFMQTYEHLQHMELIPETEIEVDVERCYYLPHHCVLKEDSTTTKQRTVFDGSAKTSSGVSLNDTLMVGPTIQDDLLIHLLRFRTHPIALSADIEKMYRQVQVAPEHQDYLRIVWREDPSQPVRHYRLKTVTYGTASAPYQATKALQQLAKDNESWFPEASKVARRDFYVDDLLSGAPTPAEAITLHQDMVNLLDRGGFPLRKWCSNSTEVLQTIPEEWRETSDSLSFDCDDHIKTLGIRWTPVSDQFLFLITPVERAAKVTKRTMLSDIASVFDPIGFNAPVTITPKIWMQELWREAIAWDDKVSDQMLLKWTRYQEQISELKHIRIPRCIVPFGSSDHQLHGFSDSSEKAYAAVVYLKSRTDNHSIISNFVIAKTKVTPIKTVSLPNLELCASVLLTKLLKVVHTHINIPITSMYGWTDSKIVLDWLSKEACTWPTFVANRVAFIQETLPASQWGHVRSEENPADCASRGISPTELREHPLWWHGPTWLVNKDEEWKTQVSTSGRLKTEGPCDDPETTALHASWYEDHDLSPNACIEVCSGSPVSPSPVSTTMGLASTSIEVCSRSPPSIRPTCLTHCSYSPAHITWGANIQKEQPNSRCFQTTSDSSEDDDLLYRYSSLRRLQRISSLCFRFINRCQKRPHAHSGVEISAPEQQEALYRCIKVVQHKVFHDELQQLTKGSTVKNRAVLKLNPFIDEAGLLRVGGRLTNSDLSSDRKHPVLLPQKHVLTTLIIGHHHVINMHAGPLALLASLTTQFWIINGRDVVRQFVRTCIQCYRSIAPTSGQLMGSLPSSRVTPARPFKRCGIDYAGPILLREMTGRGRKQYKSYIAVFVCFTTRAMHLEVVSDLKTDAFLAALKRFIGRRGRPAKLFSDCGTNFVGANNDLNELSVFIASEHHNNQMSSVLADHSITWHFNPPGAPHMGGLWEAGVKSVKKHLKATMGTSVLTYEGMVTVLAQIEGCLNSRPLCPMSSDPNDLQVLTPGHFLIGEPLNAIQDHNLVDTAGNLLDKWETLEKLHQTFWRRWYSDVLNEYQQRPKWMTPQADLKVNDLVLLKDENLPPLHWRRARIVAVHPGADNHVRVVTVQTAEKTNNQYKRFQRPIHKISRLPLG